MPPAHSDKVNQDINKIHFWTINFRDGHFKSTSKKLVDIFLLLSEKNKNINWTRYKNRYISSNEEPFTLKNTLSFCTAKTNIVYGKHSTFCLLANTSKIKD